MYPWCSIPPLIINFGDLVIFPSLLHDNRTIIMLRTRPYGSSIKCAVPSISFRNFLAVSAGQNAWGNILPVYCTIILRLSFIDAVADETLLCNHDPTAQLSLVCIFVQVLRAVRFRHTELCCSFVVRAAQWLVCLFRAQVCSAKWIAATCEQVIRNVHCVFLFHCRWTRPGTWSNFVLLCCLSLLTEAQVLLRRCRLCTIIVQN